jgi:beta-phosphoglucomutase-like phosphatase (HAD superfamily)
MQHSIRYHRIATDGDGTLYDSAEAISETFKEGLKALQGDEPVSADDWEQHYAPLIPQGWAWGQTWAAKIRIMGPKRVRMKEASADEIATFGAALGSELVGTGKLRIRPIDPVCQVMKRMSVNGIDVHLVTGTPEAMARAFVKQVDLQDTIKEIRGPERYTHGKPHPEPFLPFRGESLALEDTPNGVASACAAGIKTVIGCLRTDEARATAFKQLWALTLWNPCNVIVIVDWNQLVCD